MKIHDVPSNCWDFSVHQSGGLMDQQAHITIPWAMPHVWLNTAPPQLLSGHQQIKYGCSQCECAQLCDQKIFPGHTLGQTEDVQQNSKIFKKINSLNCPAWRLWLQLIKGHSIKLYPDLLQASKVREGLDCFSKSGLGPKIGGCKVSDPLPSDLLAFLKPDALCSVQRDPGRAVELGKAPCSR